MGLCKYPGPEGKALGYPWKGCFINPCKLKVPKVMASLSAVVAKGYDGEVGDLAQRTRFSRTK